MKRFVNPPPGARSRRLGSHDYRGGAYFVATNTRKRAPLFGTIERGWMYLSAYGKIVAEEWHRTGDLRDEVSLDAFIVMPDHVHGLLWVHHPMSESSRKENREACLPKPSQNSPTGLEKRRPGTLPTIIGAFKSAATRRISEKRDTPGETVWQSSFHDHIGRNRKELHRIRCYIRTNPQQWSQSG